MPMRISVIVPFFNEEDGIPQLAARLKGLRQQAAPRYELEFVLVDDGSRDGSRAAVERCFAGQPNIVTAVHERNRGLGAAIRTGFASSAGEIICTIDADCTYDPAGVIQLVEAMEEKNADIATASPYHPQGGVEGAKPWRMVFSRGASWVYRRICPGKLYTYTSMMRAYRRRVVENISFEADGFVAVTEILLRALARGYAAVEVPMVLRSRTTGASKLKVARTLFTHLRLMARAVSWRFAEPRALDGRIETKQDVVL